MLTCRLYQANHHSMVGSTKDPADGKAVAGSVFAAVVVYAVCYTPSEFCGGDFSSEGPYCTGEKE